MKRTVATVLSVAFAGCLESRPGLEDESSPPGRTTASLALELGVPGAELACVELAMGDGPRESRCATPVGAWATISNTVDCDPALGSVRARIWLTPLYETDFDAIYEPCGEAGCAFDLGCGTGPTTARIELAFRTGREFVPVSVATPSAWFYAGAETCQRDGNGYGAPYSLTWGGEDGGPRPTAFLTYGVSRGVDEVVPEIVASTPVLVCGPVTCELPHTDEAVALARCSDGATVRYRSTLGLEATGLPFRYLYLFVDLQSVLETGHTDCQLNAAATFGGAGLAELGRADAFPVARYHLPLVVRDGEVECARATLDSYDRVDDAIVTVEYQTGWNLRTDRSDIALPDLCHTVVDGGLTSDCD